MSTEQQTNVHLSCNYHTHIYIIAGIVAVILTSCASRQPRMEFTTAVEALEVTEAFLHSMKQRDKVTTDELVNITRQWKALGDSVRACIENDTVGNRNFHAKAALNIFRDSIADQFERLIGSRKRSFADYHKVMCQLNDVTIDSGSRRLIDEYTRFFATLDTADTYHTTGKRTVLRYEHTLRTALGKGFELRGDVFSFLTQEDMDFRAFLNHLPTLKGVPVTNVKALTEDVTRKIFALAEGDKPVMSKAEVVLLMHMRTNRRILQNAKTCVADCKKLRIKDSGMEQAYVWMLMQPWLSIDELSFALLTTEQRKDLERLADETPGIIAKLDNNDMPLKPNELPQLLMTSYIDTFLF